MPSNLVFPRSLDFKGGIALARALGDHKTTDRLLLDFQLTRSVEPLGMLYAAHCVRRFRSENPQAAIEAINSSHMGYAKHMGFFQSMGIDDGNLPGEARGSERYVPVSTLSVSEMRKEAVWRPVGEIVTSHTQRLATVLTNTDRGDLWEVISYSLREVVRNSVEHSESDTIYFCAQRWPTKNRVHLAVLDEGIGIGKSLQYNPHLTIKDDDHALKLAIMPGVSGKMFEGVAVRPYDVWQNSGFGLYMIARIGASAPGNNFWLYSGQAALGVVSGRTVSIATPCYGTALRLSLNTTTLVNIRKKIEEYAEQGDKLALQKTGITASKATTTITTNFT